MEDQAQWQQPPPDARHNSRPPSFESRTPPGPVNKPMTSTQPGLAPPMMRQQMQPMPMDPRRGSEPSHPGARPLIEDSGLGYSTGPNNVQPYFNPGGRGTRMPSVARPNEYKIRSNRGWIVLIVLMVAGLTAGVLIAMNTG
jgi:hypothetical protein